MSYCTRDDVYLLGLSAQAFVVRARPVVAADVTIATATIRMRGHGLATTDSITFEVASGGTLPTGISASTTYYPVSISGDFFRVALTQGGSPISSWVSGGSGWGIVIDQGRRLDATIVDAAAEIDDKMTAYSPPFEVDPVTLAYPQVLIGLNARLAAIYAVTSLQFENAQFRVAADQLKERVERDWKNLETYLAGRPMNPRPTDQTAIVDNGARAGNSIAATEWRTGTL